MDRQMRGFGLLVIVAIAGVMLAGCDYSADESRHSVDEALPAVQSVEGASDQSKPSDSEEGLRVAWTNMPEDAREQAGAIVTVRTPADKTDEVVFVGKASANDNTLFCAVEPGSYSVLMAAAPLLEDGRTYSIDDLPAGWAEWNEGSFAVELDKANIALVDLSEEYLLEEALEKKYACDQILDMMSGEASATQADQNTLARCERKSERFEQFLEKLQDGRGDESLYDLYVELCLIHNDVEVA